MGEATDKQYLIEHAAEVSLLYTLWHYQLSNFQKTWKNITLCF